MKVRAVVCFWILFALSATLVLSSEIINEAGVMQAEANIETNAPVEIAAPIETTAPIDFPVETVESDNDDALPELIEAVENKTPVELVPNSFGTLASRFGRGLFRFRPSRYVSDALEGQLLAIIGTFYGVAFSVFAKRIGFSGVSTESLARFYVASSMSALAMVTYWHLDECFRERK